MAEKTDRPEKLIALIHEQGLIDRGRELDMSKMTRTCVV